MWPFSGKSGDSGEAFDVKFWGSQRKLSILNRIKEVMKERVAFRDVHHDEVYFEGVIRDIDKRDYTDEIKQFDKFVGAVKNTDIHLPDLIIDLIKIYGHAAATVKTIERKEKEARAQNAIPPKLSDEQIAQLERLSTEMEGRMETIRKVVISTEKINNV